MNQDEYIAYVSNMISELVDIPAEEQNTFLIQIISIGNSNTTCYEDKIKTITEEHSKLKKKYAPILTPSFGKHESSHNYKSPGTIYPPQNNQDNNSLENMIKLGELELNKIGAKFEHFSKFYKKMEEIKLYPYNLTSKINLIEKYVEELKKSVEIGSQNLSSNFSDISRSNFVQNPNLDDEIKKIKKQIKNIAQNSPAADNFYKGIKDIISQIKYDKKKYFNILTECLKDIKKYDSKCNFSKQNSIQSSDINDQIDQIKKQIKNITQKSSKAKSAFKDKKKILKNMDKNSKAYLQTLENLFEDLKQYQFGNNIYENAKSFYEGNFLIIGTTGAGKSSFINLLDAIKQNIPISDLVRVAIKPTNHLQGSKCSELNSGDQSKSQTQSACIYNFKFAIGNIGFKINIIDTPGLGDTKGLEKDDQNIEKILEYIAKASKIPGNNLNGIILCLNGTDPRITAQVEYVLNKCRTLMPDTFYNNLFSICTNVSLFPNLKIETICKEFKYNIPSDHRFNMDNTLFSIDWVARPDLLPDIEENYRKCEAVVKNIFLKCCSCNPISANPFGKIGEERKKMRAELAALTKELQNHEQKMKKNITLKNQITNNEVEINEASLKKYKEESVDLELVPTQVETSYHNTTCNVCCYTCHKRCKLDETPDKGNPIFLRCNAFHGESTCQECGCGECGIDSHHHVKWVWKKMAAEKPKMVIDQNVINQIQKLTDKKQKKEKILNHLNNEMIQLKQTIAGKKQEILQCVTNIRNECQLFNYMEELESGKKLLEIRRTNVNSLLSKDPNNKNHLDEKDAINQCIASYTDIIETMKTIKPKQLHNKYKFEAD